MRHIVAAIILTAILTGTGLLAALSMSGTAFAEAQGSGGGCGVGGGSFDMLKRTN
jgi:hypothetical protein